MPEPKRFAYEELIQRDKVSLDLVWLRDDSLEDMDKPAAAGRDRPGDRRDLEAALAEFAAVAESLARGPEAAGP